MNEFLLQFLGALKLASQYTKLYFILFPLSCLISNLPVLPWQAHLPTSLTLFLPVGRREWSPACVPAHPPHCFLCKLLAQGGGINATPPSSHTVVDWPASGPAITPAHESHRRRTFIRTSAARLLQVLGPPHASAPVWVSGQQHSVCVRPSALSATHTRTFTDSEYWFKRWRCVFVTMSV